MNDLSRHISVDPSSKGSIHQIVQNSDTEALREILEDKNYNVNAVDELGNTTLHHAARQNNPTAIQILSQHPLIDVNKLNHYQESPLGLALSVDSLDSVYELLKIPSIDLDSLIIHNRGSQHYAKLLEILSRNPDTLFALLEHNCTETFIKLATELGQKDGDILETSSSYTFLQLACKLGHHKVVETILGLVSDPNQYTAANPISPLMIAAENGRLEVLRVLSQHPATSFDPIRHRTLWDSIFDAMIEVQNSPKSLAKISEYRRCFKYILVKISYDKLKIDDGLRWAIELQDVESVKSLTDAGAYIGRKSHQDGSIPLTLMSASLLKRYLDGHISANQIHGDKSSSTIIFDYTMLFPQLVQPSSSAQHEEKCCIYNIVSETEPLLRMNDTQELREFLEHPLLASFITIKWHTVSKYFFLNILFYVSFCISLSCYISFGDTPSLKSNAPGGIITRSPTKPSHTDSSHFDPVLPWVSTYLLYVILMLRESFKYHVSSSSYVRSPENWIQICLIGSTGVLLNIPLGLLRCQFASISILTSWMGFAMLLAHYPLPSAQMEIYKILAINLLRSLTRYSILIISLGVAYYTLDKFQLAPIPLPSFSALLPSVISELLLDTISSHVKFNAIRTSILFIVIFSFILLFNSNWLTTSKTQIIQTSGRLERLASQIKFISYVENMAVNVPPAVLQFFDTISRLCFRSPERLVLPDQQQRVTLLPHFHDHSTKVEVNPCEGNSITLRGYTLEMPTDIVMDALKITRNGRGNS